MKLINLRKIKKLNEVHKLLYLIPVLITSSCYHQKTPNFDNRGMINTYSSPAAYYGKPISRMFVNPYDLDGPQYYFDNDVHYIPPQSYGSPDYVESSMKAN